MKVYNFIKICVLILLGFNNAIIAQSDCKVYPSKIVGYYAGECKKGLANGDGYAEGIDTYEGHFKKGYPDGMGTYTWKNGNVYTGEFKKGLKEGEGELTFTINRVDTTTVGFWEKDQYIGITDEPAYKIFEKLNIDNVSVTYTDLEVNQAVIMFYQNGTNNQKISEISVQYSSGNYSNQGTSGLRFMNIELPFEGKISYRTQTKLRTSMIYCSFRFKINRDGKWDIRVRN